MMPVRGDKVQKRVNERGRNYNVERDIINLGLLGRDHHGQQDPYLDVEDWEELEALLEREQHLLGQHHHRSDPASINLLHSPDQTLRPPLGTLPRRNHTPRTIPRTHGNFSVPLNQLSSILLNMTFSDAEEDHQGSRNAREAQSGTGAGGTNRERSTSRSRTESGVSNASTASLVTPSSSGPAANGQTHAESPSRASTAEASGASNLEMSDAAQSVSVADMKGVDSKKIMEKLQQIQGYIQQTTTAMTALEQQGDTSNIGKYNTLVKVLRDLKDSETKLKAHLEAAKKSEAAAQVANGCQNNESVTSPVNGGEETEEEIHNTGGNRVVGVVGPGNVATLQERLAASQEESAAIMGRMRASIARREDLMVRYKATRERLENLKKQQQNMRNQEEQQVQQQTGENESGYEDPIPGVENWSVDEIRQGLEEFQSLLDKVERLQGMYAIKAQNVDPDDEEAQTAVASKLGQLASKRRLLVDTVARLRRIQRQSQDDQQADSGDGPARSQRNSTVPVETPDSNQGTSTERLGEIHSTTSEATPRTSIHANDEISQINMNSTASNVAEVSDEILSRQRQLQSLQKQLGDMKKLLDVTTAARKEDERRMLESQKRLEEAEAAKVRLSGVGTEAERAPVVEGAVGGEVLEIAGRRIRLSEAERQNPEVMHKYQEIAKAKERLSRMEEVMEMIANAKRNNQNLREVIPPDYLALLEEAEAERDEAEGIQHRPPPEVAIMNEPEEEIRSSRRHLRTSRLCSASRSDASASLGRNERDHRMREKENSEISAMQKRLNKTSTRVSAINEGSRHGHEKGAVKKQPQALWEEGSSTIDPRVSEVLAMQEELKQKKNALEALMKRMGKSSSLNMDNISDNISDNVSETSDRLDGGNGTAATWGTTGLHDYSDNHYQHSSDEDLIEEENDDGEVPARSHRRTQQPPVPPKDRNRHSATRHRRRQDSGRFSVNNLTTAHSGRPKHNRLRGSSVPKASWESVGTVEGASFKSPSNTTLQAHQTLGAALSQLSQVQGTINNLQESLRQEQNQVLGTLPSPYSQFLPQYLPDIPSAGVTPSSLSHVPGIGVTTSGVQALTPMSPYAGLGSLALGSQAGGSETVGQLNQQLMMGLQQCFSQLHLHSLEIQALSKHLQLLDRRDQVDSVPMPDSGNGRVDRRRGRAGTRRSEEEEDEEEDDDDEEEVTAGTRPSYPLHHNLLAASLTRDGKESVSRVPQSLSYPLFLSQPGEEGHSTGVTNPIYGRLGDIRDQPGTWGSQAPTPGTEQPSEQLASMLGVAGIVDNSPSHPLLHLDRMSEERPQSQPPEDHHWSTLTSAHPLHHQTTDLLNNQVPPGTRANNYWDNFRSYSRQNLLSTTTKSNTSDHHPASTTSTSAAVPSGSAGLHQTRESGRVEDKRFNVTVSHNNNSSSGAGARARVSNPHLINPRGANPRVRNPVSSNSQQVLGQNKHKTNNRNKQSGWWMPGSGSNVPGTNVPQGIGSAGNSRDRSSVNYNFTRGNSTDSDGTGAMTLEVLREAEALMRRHANQPQFLLQLFHHASQITAHTDQHVAVALLQDLAAQPHGSNHGVNANRRSSNNEANGLSLPAPLRDSSWHQQASPSRPHNILPRENVSVVGLSGSEVSDSGLTSEDEDSRALYRNVKNLSLSPSGQVGLSGAIPRSTPGINTTNLPRPQFPQPRQYQPQFPQHNYQYFPQQQSLSNIQGSSRSVANSESSLYDHLIFNDSHISAAHPQQVVEDWICQSEGDGRGEKLQNQPETVGSSPEDAHHITHPLNNDTEYLTFETLVSSAVRTSVEILQSQAGGTLAAGTAVSLHLLNSLHTTLVAQIQTQAQSLQLPQSFLSSVDTELKGALQAFIGKPLLDVSNDVPSVVSQVLLTQYCSVLVQRLRDNHPGLPQTPTKLPQSKMNEAGTGNVASTSSTSHGRHTQENTTATQTESSVFSLTPHQHAGLSHATELSQRSNHHGSRTFSLTSSTGSSVTHGSAHSSHPSSHVVAHASMPSSSPHPPPHIATSIFHSSSSGSGQWQVPPSAPLPSPNDNGTSVEALIDNSVNSHQASQPESWAVSSSIGQVAENSAPASPPDSRLANNVGQSGGATTAEWAVPEHEEAMMDDIVEPALPVHDLAEADQSQDAGDAAEGDWEDSQAEGIQGDSVGAAGNASPQHPSWLQSRGKSSQLDTEGMVECDADAAEGTTRGAVEHLGYAEHLGHGATRELELDEVPTKLQSPEGGSPGGSPEHHSSPPQGHQRSTPPSHGVKPSHSPGGSEG